MAVFWKIGCRKLFIESWIWILPYNSLLQTKLNRKGNLMICYHLWLEKRVFPEAGELMDTYADVF